MRLSLLAMTNHLSRVAPFKGMTNHLHLFISSQCCFLSSNSSTSTEDYPVHVVLYNITCSGLGPVYVVSDWPFIDTGIERREQLDCYSTVCNTSLCLLLNFTSICFTMTRGIQCCM